MMRFSAVVLAAGMLLAGNLLADSAAYKVPENHPWMNRVVAFLGDSITDPWHIGTTRNYWQDLGDWLKLEYRSYGQNGRQWTAVSAQADCAINDFSNRLDAVFIFMGTNDFMDSVPLGEWYREQYVDTIGFHGERTKRKHREYNFDESTYRGRINKQLKYLKNKLPDCQIILMTPIHRAFAQWGGGNVQQDEMYANALGIYFEEYVKSVREAGEIWSMPVIDLYAMSGLLPTEEAHIPLFNDPNTDKLHPNAKGHERLARTICAKLLSIAPTFK